MAYENSVSGAYQPAYFDTLWDWVNNRGCMREGVAREECPPMVDEYNRETAPILAAFRTHLAFLDENPAPHCLADAYTSDRAVTQSVIAWITPPRVAEWGTWGGGRQQILDFNKLMASVTAFEQKLPAYLSTCG